MKGRALGCTSSKGSDLVALQLDPRRLEAEVRLADTLRGPMPHIHGAISRDAVRATLEVADLGAAPSRVTGTRFAFVAFAGMTLLDLVGAFDPIYRIASIGVDREATVTLASADGRRVWTAPGVELTLTSVRPPLNAYDVAVIPGESETRAGEGRRCDRVARGPQGGAARSAGNGSTAPGSPTSTLSYRFGRSGAGPRRARRCWGSADITCGANIRTEMRQHDGAGLAGAGPWARGSNGTSA